MSGRKSEEGNSGRAVENSLQPGEMKVLGGGYLTRLTVPFGSGHPGKCYRTSFLRVEMKATIVVTPEMGFASGDLSVDDMCQGTSQQSGGRL